MPPDTIDSINKLLKADPNDKGFIIFSGKNEFEYVQFMIEHNGLILSWPILPDVEIRNNKVSEMVCRELVRKNFNRIHTELLDEDVILGLKYKEFVVDSTEIFANTGTDATEIAKIVEELFLDIFQYSVDEIRKIEIELEL